MGTQATGKSGTSAATRLTYVVLGAVLVTLFAGLLLLSGAESAEVIATLLFAVVFAATLMVGRTAGFAAAALSTLLYAWLRQGAMEDAGTAMWVLVVLGRAASYLVLAYVTDMMRNRLPRLPFGGGSRSKARSSSGAPARRRAAGEGVPTALPAGPGEPEAVGQWQPAAQADDRTAWQPAAGAEVPGGPVGEPYGMQEPPGAPTPVPGQPAVDPWAPEGQWGHEEPAAAAWAAGPSAPAGWQEPEPHLPAAQHNPGDGRAMAAGGGNVPSGWLQDEDYGEAIPVGYTGELFLQDLTGPPPAPAPVDDAAPMIDGMPFGQPLDNAPDPTGSNGYDQGGVYGHQGADDYGRQPFQDSPPFPVDQYPVDDATATYGSVGAGDLGGYSGYGDHGGHDAYGGTGGHDGGFYEPPGASTGYTTPGYGGEGVNGTAAADHHIDPETRLWTAGFFRDRLAEEYETAHATGQGFSVVMIQIPDTPFQTLSYRRQVALLRELGYQFIRAQVVDHLVHLPDGDHHWFAAVLSGTDRTGAHAFERRLRSAIAGYLRNRGLGLADIQSATLTSPDDDATMSEIWSSLLGGQEQTAPNSTW